MAPMAAAGRNVSHNRFHHNPAVDPICDPQHLGKGVGGGGSAAAAAAAASGFAYMDHHQHHLGYPYHHHQPTSSTFTAADFLCGTGADSSGNVPAAAVVARYDQEASNGRLLGANYFTSQQQQHYHHLGLGDGGFNNNGNKQHSTAENDNISEPTTPPVSSVAPYHYTAGHHHLKSNEAYQQSLHDMGVTTGVAVSHDGYATLTPPAAAVAATAADYVTAQPRQHDHQQQQQQHDAHAYAGGGAYESRTGDFPPAATIYWDGDMPMAHLSLDA